jgi:AraC-like DNA-binding protein
MTVGDVAARLQLSRRRLAELFTAEVGLSPKRYARVRRFQRARALARQARAAGWGAIALASGYSDQPHLVRDFLAFSGFSPVDLARRSAAPVKEGHVADGLTPDAAASSRGRAPRGVPRP